MKLVVIGRGKFADVFFHGMPQVNSDIVVLPWEKKEEGDLFLHVGSGRQWNEVVDYCQEVGRPLIQASTAEKFSAPDKLNFPFIEAPNLSLPIVKLFYLLDLHPQLFEGLGITLLESHQEDKKTLPGTALKLMELAGGKEAAIESLRDPSKQKELGIPDEFLEGHAFHRLLIQGLGAEIKLETKILGRESYLHGVSKIAQIIPKLEKRFYFVSDLIKQELI